jgi:hypothetical protein
MTMVKDEVRASETVTVHDDASLGTASWAAYKQMLCARRKAMGDALASGRFSRGLRATRMLVAAQAIAVIIVGFILDDLAILKVPGFVVGLGGAVVILGLAGLPQGVWIARRTQKMDKEQEDVFLSRVRNTGRGLFLLMVIIGVLFLIVIGAGVPPWV